VIDPADLEGGERHIRRGDGTEVLRYRTARDAPRLAVTVARAPPGHTEELCFTGHREIGVVLEGKARIEALEDDEVWRLEPGSVLVVGPGWPHRLTAESDLRLLAFHQIVPPEAAQRFHRLPGEAQANTSRIDEGDGLGVTLCERRAAAGAVIQCEAESVWRCWYVARGSGLVHEASEEPEIAVAEGTLVALAPGETATFAADTALHLFGAAAADVPNNSA